MSQADKPASSRINRRASPRWQFRGSARVECRRGTLGLGPNLVRLALDISETGIRLLLGSPLVRGEQVEVLIHSSGVRPLKRFARVAWSAAADGGWQVGLTFEGPLPYQEVQNLARPPRVMR
jgi:PilZ domain-containing protein